MSGEILDRVNIQTFNDFIKLLPNVMTAGQGPGQNQTYMRGPTAIGTSTPWADLVLVNGVVRHRRSAAKRRLKQLPSRESASPTVGTSGRRSCADRSHDPCCRTERPGGAAGISGLPRPPCGHP